jgi:hypothetical protein
MGYVVAKYAFSVTFSAIPALQRNHEPSTPACNKVAFGDEAAIGKMENICGLASGARGEPVQMVS